MKIVFITNMMNHHQNLLLIIYIRNLAIIIIL